MNKTPRFGTDLGKNITPFVVISNPATYRHQIYIHNNLEAPDELIAILDVLYQANENDEVVIHLNSGGGAIDSLDTLLSAMSACPAHIHVVATGTIASAATFILLAADSFEVSPFATLLFHACSFHVYGESQDNLEYVQFIHNESERLMRSYYKHIFSEEEIDDIIVNKRQKWLTSAEFQERFEKAKEEFVKEDKANIEQAKKDFETLLAEDTPSKDVLKKVKQSDLVRYIAGEIDILVENGKPVIVELHADCA